MDLDARHIRVRVFFDDISMPVFPGGRFRRVVLVGKVGWPFGCCLFSLLNFEYAWLAVPFLWKEPLSGINARSRMTM